MREAQMTFRLSIKVPTWILLSKVLNCNLDLIIILELGRGDLLQNCQTLCIECESPPWLL